ncbi:MAG: hypothetical protein QOI01_730 [Mycobacterium sp.]|jgi:hypothetical protein|nr:hypothetical protein [Mycobacterium sp.]
MRINRSFGSVFVAGLPEPICGQLWRRLLQWRMPRLARRPRLGSLRATSRVFSRAHLDAESRGVRPHSAAAAMLAHLL